MSPLHIALALLIAATVVTTLVAYLSFVLVDIGRPDRFWHLIPGIGKFNFPGSMLSWDVIVLNGYLVLNVWICGYLLYSRYQGKKPSKWFYIPFVFIAIVWAVSIHTVTAFLYVGLGGRPFWNSANNGVLQHFATTRRVWACGVSVKPASCSAPDTNRTRSLRYIR